MGINTLFNAVYFHIFKNCHMEKILSFLLYHANKYPYLCDNKEIFYAVKSKLLSKYANTEGYDMQKIKGKECYSCHGTGYHKRYDWVTGEVYRVDGCWHCFGGWYKLPNFNILQRYRFGKYLFHSPVKTFHSLQSVMESEYYNQIKERIDGYVEHSKGNRNVAMFFWLVFLTRPAMRYFFKNIGVVGYYQYWWKPYNFLNNIVGLFRSSWIRKQFLNQIKRSVMPKKQTPVIQSISVNYDMDDLPF